MNKKGSITDILIAAVMLMIAAIVILFVVYLWTQISGNALFQSAAAKPIVASVNTAYSFLADALVVMFFMSCFAAILLAYLEGLFLVLSTGRKGMHFPYYCRIPKQPKSMR